MRRAFLTLLYAISLGGTAQASAKPESLEKLTYNLNTVLNEKLDGKAFLNGRPIVRLELFLGGLDPKRQRHPFVLPTKTASSLVTLSALYDADGDSVSAHQRQSGPHRITKPS